MCSVCHGLVLPLGPRAVAVLEPWASGGAWLGVCGEFWWWDFSGCVCLIYLLGAAAIFVLAPQWWGAGRVWAVERGGGDASDVGRGGGCGVESGSGGSSVSAGRRRGRRRRGRRCPGLIVGRAATAEDYAWFAGVDDLAEGFCFTWVRGLTPEQVITLTGGTELERIAWEQLVGSGDGQEAGADRYFYGVAHVGDWALLVEDSGSFGTTDSRVRPLSRGTTLVSHYRARDGHGRLLVLEDEDVRLDFDPIEAEKITGRGAGSLAPIIDAAGFSYARRLRSGDQTAYRKYCMEAAFALTERLTGIGMTEDLLEKLTYLLTSVPR